MLKEYRDRREIFRPLLPALCWLLLCTFAVCLQGQDEATRTEKQFVKQLQTDIQKIENLVEKSRGPQAQKAYEAALKRLTGYSSDPSPALAKLVKPEIERLEKLQARLRELGFEVDAPSFPDGDNPSVAGDQVSFAKDVAPILVAKCGNCHVRGTRGNFNMATYQALSGSGMIVPGDPVLSRLIQVIDSGEMPKGGLTVTPDELNRLRTWVAAGANNDGPANENLARLGNATPPPDNAPPSQPLTMQPPTGTETVSFSREIAPILVDQCRGCHVESNRPRGGLNLDSFASLLRGGDSGALLVPRRSAESLLVKKLEGTGGGNRMPAQRDPLKREQIELVKRWIDEGAAFDGGSPDLPLRSVATTAKAASQDHAALSADRRKVAEENWKKSLPDTPAQAKELDDFRVFSSFGGQRLDELCERIAQLTTKIKSQLGLPKDAPLAKGNLTLYLFERRYDFNELSTMVEGYPLPKDTRATWKNNVVDIYVAMAIERTADLASVEAELARQIAAAAVSAMSPRVPDWFASGVGYAVAERMFTKSDEVKAWRPAAQASLNRIAAVEDLTSGKFSRELIGLAGFQLVAALQSQDANFKRLLAELRKGTEFSAAFAAAYKRDAAVWLAEALQRPR